MTQFNLNKLFIVLGIIFITSTVIYINYFNTKECLEKGFSILYCATTR